jgi:3-methyladenine DNA glycosylase AlkD
MVGRPHGQSSMVTDKQVPDLYSEVVKQLEKLDETEASEARIQWFEEQHKGSTLRSYGIKTSKVRRLIGRYRGRFKQLNLETKFELAKRFYESGFFEQATIGDAVVELSVPSLTPTHFDRLDEVASCFNNWASVDWLCLRVLQPLLLKYREATLTLVKRWNRSKNKWKRRASVVAFVRKIGASGDFTDEALELCDNLVWDKEDIVQKGVGWALKDNLSGARRRVLDYVKSLRRKGVSSTITLYAIRDVKGKERREILEARPDTKQKSRTVT